MNLLSTTFLAPIAFLGMIGIAVPVYLHLRHKPRALPLKFAAFEFLMRARRKQKRRLRVEQWLLMALRAGVLALLAVIFAQPFRDELFQANSSLARRPYLMVLDDSMSMMAGDKESYFASAIATMNDHLSQRSDDAPTALLVASAPESHLANLSASSLRGVLNQLAVSTQRVTLDDAYQRALSLLTEQGWENATVQIFSDGNRSAWTNLPEPPPDTVEVIYTSARAQRPALKNVGIVSVTQPPGFSERDLDIRLRNGSNESVNFEIRVQSETQDLRHKLVLDRYQETSHRFSLDEASQRVTVSLPADDFLFDNRTIFAPDEQERTRVLIVDGDPSPKRQESEAFFFEHALNLHQRDNQAIQVDTLSSSGLDIEELEPYDVICLLNVATPPVDQLDQFMRHAKGLLIAMGDRMDFDRWNPVFGDLGLELYETKRFGAPNPVEIKLGDHPVFSNMKAGDLELYAGGIGINAFRLVSVGRSSFSIPLTLSDGTPLLLANQVQDKRFVLWTSTMDLAWTDFPLQPGFLPMVRQMIDYLTFKETRSQSVQMTVDEALSSGYVDRLVLKQAQPGYRDIRFNGPVPGIYSDKDRADERLVHLVIDPVELDFTPLQQESSEAAATEMESLGFKELARLDLAPSLIWWLFALVLVETLIAGRLSLKWGSR